MDNCWCPPLLPMEGGFSTKLAFIIGCHCVCISICYPEVGPLVPTKTSPLDRCAIWEGEGTIFSSIEWTTKYTMGRSWKFVVLLVINIITPSVSVVVVVTFDGEPTCAINMTGSTTVMTSFVASTTATTTTSVTITTATTSTVTTTTTSIAMERPVPTSHFGS